MRSASGLGSGQQVEQTCRISSVVFPAEKRKKRKKEGLRRRKPRILAGGWIQSSAPRLQQNWQEGKDRNKQSKTKWQKTQAPKRHEYTGAHNIRMRQRFEPNDLPIGIPLMIRLMLWD